MKLLKLLLIGSLSVLFSCGTQSSPEKTVKEFYKAINEKQYEKAKEFVTSDSKSVLEMMGSNIELTLGGNDISNVDCVTENEISNCDCFIEGKDKPVPVTLIKENEKWKLDLKASAINVVDDLLDGLKGIDLNGLMEKVGDGVDLSSDGINELINSIDVDKAVETLKGLDSNLNETGGNLENLINQVTEGLEKSQNSN